MSDIEECEKAKVGRREKYPYSVWIMDLTQKMGADTFIISVPSLHSINDEKVHIVFKREQLTM